MKSMKMLLIAFAASTHAGLAMAATVGSGTDTLAATAALAESLPDAREFAVTAAGQVRVTLVDQMTPQAFAKLKLLVSRDGAKVLVLDAPGEAQFAATPGTYKVQVLGEPAAAAPRGAFDVEVREMAGNTVLLSIPDGDIAALAPPPTAESALNNVPVEIAKAGTYELTLTDRVLPAELADVDLYLMGPAGSGFFEAYPEFNRGAACLPVCTKSFAIAMPGTYLLTLVARAGASEEAGLYSLVIRGGPDSATVYAETHAVGRLPAPVELTLPAADTYTLAATDHGAPAPLELLRVRLMQGAGQLAALDGDGSAATSGAQAGAARLFVFGKAAAAASAKAGIYTVAVNRGAQSVHRATHTLPDGYDAAANTGGYLHPITIPTSGDYRLRLRDLAFVVPFARVSAVIVQNGQTKLDVRSANESVIALSAGQAFLAVVASPQSANGNSLLGISLAPAAGGTALEEWTQGVGPLIASIAVDVATAGPHDLTIRDLQFPAAFGELAVAVTRGPELIHTAFGGGEEPVSFTAQPGRHYLNLLARPAAGEQYATWGYLLANTPVPTVTLSATPTSVASGATTSLTWSSTGATSCTASGGWSGTQTTSGTATSAALTARTTFTLTCTGAGGTANASVEVTITGSGNGGNNGGSSGGGGGAFGAGTLLLLSGLLYAQHRRRRAVLA